MSQRVEKTTKTDSKPDSHLGLPNLFKSALLSLALPLSLGYSANTHQPDLKTYHEKVKPLLMKYCADCHGERKAKAKIRFDTMDPNILGGIDGGKWEDAQEQFNTGEMPPDDEAQPTDAEREIITQWLDQEFKKASVAGRTDKTGEVRRLTRYELKHSLEDLFKVTTGDTIHQLPDESPSHETGLKNNTHLLRVSGPYLESYLDTIYATIEQVKEKANLISYSTHLAMADVVFKEPGPLYTEDNVEAKPQDIEKQAKTKPKAEKKKKVQKEKSAFTKAIKVEGGIELQSGGYMTMPITRLPKGILRVPIELTTLQNKESELQLQIGFKYSDTDRREVIETFGFTKAPNKNGLQTVMFEGTIDHLSEVMRKSFEREYFIRVTNKGGTLFVKSMEFIGNINDTLKTNLLGKDNDVQNIQNPQTLLTDFITKAYRRHASESEIKKYFNIYKTVSKTASALDALLYTYEEILCSPNFLYLGIPGELSPAQEANYTLAEKLSYFLWSSIPDEALLKDAQNGTLSQDSVLRAHVQRMLKDKRGKRMVENFTDQCLDSEKLFNVAVDNGYYKSFKDTLKPHMRQETVESINAVFRKGDSALNLIKADHVFVNQDLAKFYGIKGVQGSDFRKVQIEEKHNRGGLLTQGTFLIGNSDGINSHAILRGVWLTSIILNSPPPEPPKNVPPLDETIPGFDKMTLNQKMEVHRNNDACRTCHNKIDPWGMAFENYDASGAWRDRVLVMNEVKAKGKKKSSFEKIYHPIEREATLPSKHKVDGMLDLKNYIFEHHQEGFAEGITERLLSYALSRDVDFYDAQMIEELNHHFMKNNFSVPALIENIVLSDAFKKGNS